MKSITDTLLVSIDLATDGSNAVLLVGRKGPKQIPEIVNAFQANEAVELYNRLIGRKMEESSNVGKEVSSDSK